MNQKASTEEQWLRVKHYKDLKDGLSAVRKLNNLLIKLNVTKVEMMPVDFECFENWYIESYKRRIKEYSNE